MATDISSAPRQTIDGPVISLKARPELGAEAYCGDCWEPIAHDGEEWRHVRTGLSAHWKFKACKPLCDWPECNHDADTGRSLGRDEWTGSGFRWRATHFLCTEHWDRYRQDAGTIERT